MATSKKIKKGKQHSHLTEAMSSEDEKRLEQDHGFQGPAPIDQIQKQKTKNKSK